MVRIELDEQAPSVNHIWGHTTLGRGKVTTYLTPEGRSFKERLAKAIPKESILSPLRGELKASLFLFFADKRRRDIDNYCKGILDALNAKVYLDDSQIIELHIKKLYAKRPKIIIEIEEINDDSQRD